MERTKRKWFNKTTLSVEWKELDFLIIDFPPGTSDEHISIAQLFVSKKKYY